MVRSFVQDVEELKALLAVARGDAPAETVLRGGKLVNVLSGEGYPAEIALFRGRIAGVSLVAGTYSGETEVDLAGEYITPGFIDGHMHIESSLVVPPEFSNAVLPHGTTSVVTDPHEIANVHGIEGIRFMLASSEGLPLRVFVMLSSCVPATDMETSGARLSADDLAGLLSESRVLGMAEMMNYPGVVLGLDDMVRKAVMGHQSGVRMDGHSPLLSGQALQAYASAGIASDHESVSASEALEKLRAGLHVLIREGSTARNLDALLPVVNERTSRFCSFATDDKQPNDLARDGHIDHCVRRAIVGGVDPVTAIQMATINTARHFGLDDLGAIAPGYLADMVTFADLREPRISRTFSSGKLVAENGQVVSRSEVSVAAPRNLMHAANLRLESFAIRCEGKLARAIGVLPDQIVTRSEVVEVSQDGGYVVSDTQRDILKIAVIERHKGTGNVGLGLVKGFGLRAGAVASSIAHDSHNLVVIGVSDAEMLLAAQTVIGMGGGICAVRGGEVLGQLPLPVAGLMSDQPWESVRDAMQRLLEAAHDLGCPLDNPYMAMAFLALPVIPELKLTDLGLVDVTAFQLCPLFV
ncbi:MAG TPA: adenine deaminase [Chloroflexia bacterium]|nr:adenine deaminase [Chloroflexia bacterium]